MIDKVENNIIRYGLTDCVIAFLLVAASMFYRPMLLGNNYTPIGMILFILAIVFSVIRTRWKIKFSRSVHSRTYVTAMLLFVYCFFQAVILHSDRLQAGMQTVVLLMIAVTAFYVGFSNKAVESIFIRIIYFLLMAFVCSYIISIVLMLVWGWNAIQVTSLNYGYFIQTGVYFPFTTTYGNMTFNGIELRRLLGFARESGIMQIFYIWGFYSADKYFKDSRVVQILMVIGVAACLSTAGFIVFGVSLLFYFDVRSMIKNDGYKHIVVVVTLIVAMVYILFYARGTSISDRSVSTIADRITGIAYGLNVFVHHPIFGSGFYSTLGNANVQTGVCALATLGQVGIVGIGLWLMIFAFAFNDCINKKRFIYTNAALFITAVFAQPMVFAPTMYWFLFCNYDSSRIKLIKKDK